MKRLPLLVWPAVFFVLGAVVALAAIRVVEFAWPEPKTLLEAVEQQWTGTTYRMIAHGEDPGISVKAKRQILQYWGPGQTTSPLLVGIARGDADLVAYMVENTRLLETAPNDQALCVAGRFGHSNVAKVLFRAGVVASPLDRCDGQGARPEDIAERFGHGSMAKALRHYRLEIAESSPAG